MPKSSFHTLSKCDRYSDLRDQTIVYGGRLEEVENSGKFLNSHPKKCSRLLTRGSRLLGVPTVRVWLGIYLVFWIGGQSWEGVAFDRWSHVEIWLYYNYPWMQEWPDHFTFLWNCPPTPPLSQHYTKFLLRAKCWLRRGVGGQFHRNVKWSKWPILDYIVDDFDLWLWTHSKALANHTFYFIFLCAFWRYILFVASHFQQTNDCLFLPQVIDMIGQTFVHIFKGLRDR